ncbi:MAG: hypothetical protein GWN94_24855 [Phycisphaerae bacterium]|nr:hypothetical protein [Phycisphaerae bacterium]NIP56326.1 hypothetical protein [Phycisphaerae bacterium]NIS54284.1 hypothetical protein [Phycisphaerae bacterium]NIX29849.1 hypothetical protein [Phycisphaerae bacterium]
MFVKVIYHNVPIEKGSPRTVCYDCVRYDLYPGQNDKTFSLSVDVGEQSPRVMQLEKGNHSVIVMNSEGKTVDRYRWNSK